jgi:chorismate dehydratase
MTVLAIGGVPFGVGAPLLCGLDRTPGVRLVQDAPRRLIEGLRAGSLDAALVSSIEAFRQPGYRVVPGLAIAAAGPARSVRAFLRTPAKDVRSLGLDAGSATSVALLEVLLRTRHGARIEQRFDIDPGTPPDAVDADAVLLIGDAGLRARSARTVLDLGEDWHRWQALPFVFALWLLRPGADARALVPHLHAARQAALDKGLEDGTGGAVYYRFGDAERLGLARFRAEAAALGLCDPRITPEFL